MRVWQKALWSLAVALSVAGGLGVLRMSAQAKNHVAAAVIAARAEDVATIDGLVKASYETISGGVGVARQWDRDRTLYDANVRFLAMGKDPKTGLVTSHGTGYQDYLDESDPSLVSSGFTERELARETRQYGNVATVLSSYEGRSGKTGKVLARGVNIFQLYNDGKRWWILSIIWDEERADNPIPKELLPKP